LLRHKTGITTTQSANALNLDRTGLHKQLTGLSAGRGVYENHLTKHLGFNPFTEYESVTGLPVAKRAAQDVLRKRRLLESEAALNTPGQTPGLAFLNWVRHQLLLGELTTNTQKSLVHVLPQGVFLVAPALFERYLQEGYEGAPRTLRQLQEAIEKGGLNIKNQRRINVRIATQKDGGIRLHGYLFPQDLLFFSDQDPPLNQKLNLEK